MSLPMHLPSSQQMLWLLQEFTVTAILAYECGYSEDLIRDEVTSTGGTVLGNDFQQVSYSHI